MKRIARSIVAVPVILLLAHAMSSCSANDTTPTATVTVTASASSTVMPTPSVAPTTPVAPDPRQAMLTDLVALIGNGPVYDTGNYIAGSIPAGEYAFIPLDTDRSHSYSEDDPNDEILDNELFASFGYVHVWGTGNLTTEGILIAPSAFTDLGVTGAKQLWAILNNMPETYSSEGMYRIGTDLPAGKYTLTGSDDGGYASVNSGPVGNGDIINNEIFFGQWQITVKDGQYLELSRASLAPA